MKRFHLHMLVLILLCTLGSRAQIVATDEDKDLAFQNYFFEALKQKAIQNYSKAVENLEKCYELDSTELIVAFELSQNFLKLKKYFEAEQFINKALQQDSSNEYLLLHKSEIYKDIGNFEQAIVIQKELAARFPKYNDGLLELYIRSKNYEQGTLLIKDIETKAQSTNKTRIYKQFLQNRARITTGNVVKKEEAHTLESLRESFASNKNYNDLKKLLVMEEQERRFEMLVIDSKEGLALFPAQPFVYLMHAKAQYALGKYNEAISVLGIGIDFVMDDSNMEIAFYEELAKNYAKLNDTMNARKYEEKAAEIRQKTK